MSRKLVIFLFSLIIFSQVKAQVPDANFSADHTHGCGTTVVTFRDLSTNNPTSWLWDFGDATTPSTVRNPAHTYSVPGVFNVKLTAINASGRDTMTKASYITIYSPPTINFSADRTSGCIPQTINFTDLSVQGNSGIASWQWDFGDGHSSTLRNPSNVYPNAGLYNVSLAVTDSNRCTSRLQREDYLNIETYPAASFSATNRIGCNIPLNVSFTNTSTGNNLTYQWDFGDLGTSTQPNPTHNYITRGNFTVNLIATSGAGCSDTLTNLAYVQINNADFSANNTSGCIPFSVDFTNLSTAGDTAWSWNFGDLGTSNQRNPNHVYAASGIYTVNLTVYYRGGCSVTKTLTSYIRANSIPVVTFSASDSTQCQVPFPVTFTNTTPGFPQTALWVFGDGGTSTTNPTISHTYNTLGKYNVTLAVTNSNGCIGTLTRPNFIQIVKPAAHFVTNTTQGCKPLPVIFTDNSSSNSPISSWNWNFGDGNTSNTQNTSYVFNSPNDTASFAVKLTIINADGCRDSSILRYIYIGNQPNIRFSADDSAGCHPFKVNFSDLTTGFVNGWIWNFGDGRSDVMQNPIHTFRDTVGNFDVQLIASRFGCADTLKIDSFIKVFPPRPKFSAMPRTGCNDSLNVIFTDLSIGAISWKWDFGDGTTSDFQNPAHLYQNAGFYTVRLIVRNNNGCTDTITKTDYIKIWQRIIEFKASDTSICKLGSVTFKDTSWCNTNIARWKWDFGDGNILSTVVAGPQTHTYLLPGVYNVKLVLTDDVLGCKDSLEKINFVKVYDLPNIHFGALTTTGCSPLSVGFRDTVTAAPGASVTRMHWNFGTSLPADTSALHNPAFRYLTPGSFNVTLTATDSRGCINTLTKNNLIHPTHPVPSFSSPSMSCYNDNVWFSGTSQGSGLQYTWNFGDGSPVDHRMNPNHDYIVTATRTFNVQLAVTDINGCDSSITKPVIISRPVVDFAANLDSLFYCPPLFVPFHDSSSLDVNQWQWIFGDSASGSANHSMVQNAQHVYNNIGTFDITLIGTNSDGCSDTMTKPGYISLEGPHAPMFHYSPVSGCTPLQVTFYEDNVYNTTRYRWIFGDGNISTLDSVTHSYTEGGDYMSALELSDTLGCKVTIIAPAPIHVISGIPDFYVDTTFACSTATFHFNDSSTAIGATIDTWLWNFGDGTYSSLQNPDHEYSIPGAYDVTLTITIGSCVDSLTINDFINIYTPPRLNITALDTIGCEPVEVQFGVASSPAADSITSWRWNFGDGPMISNDSTPSHLYDSSATYPVTLNTTFLNGCNHTYLRPTILTIWPNPTANFSYSPTTPDIFADLPILFKDSSTGDNLLYRWDFGDGSSISTDSTPTHQYDYIGDYDVILVVITSPYGCKDTIKKTITLPERIMDYNAFSPDGDGTNDIFAPDMDLVILNRWGQKMYEGKEGWDGNYNGKKAPEGTYYFIITIDEVKGQKGRVLKGSVTLLRKTH